MLICLTHSHVLIFPAPVLKPDSCLLFSSFWSSFPLLILSLCRTSPACLITYFYLFMQPFMLVLETSNPFWRKHAIKADACLHLCFYHDMILTPFTHLLPNYQDVGKNDFLLPTDYKYAHWHCKIQLYVLNIKAKTVPQLWKMMFEWNVLLAGATHITEFFCHASLDPCNCACACISVFYWWIFVSVTHFIWAQCVHQDNDLHKA